MGKITFTISPNFNLTGMVEQMADLIFVATIIGFFLLAFGYLKACEKLGGGSQK